jgi:hypothetical protein
MRKKVLFFYENVAAQVELAISGLKRNWRLQEMGGGDSSYRGRKQLDFELQIGMKP